MTERQIESIKKKIKKNRAVLAAEKRKFGCYDDSHGRRYLIALLNTMIKDYKAALKYFNWFDKEFPDDVGFPDFNLYRAAAYFENNLHDKVIPAIYKTVFSNIYLLDLMVGKNPTEKEFVGNSNIDKIEYAKYVVDACVEHISDEFMNQVKLFTESDKYKRNLKEFISIEKLISDERPSEMRSKLIDESRKFEDKLTKL